MEHVITSRDVLVRRGIIAFQIVLFAFLTGIGGMIKIPLPFTPVPLTLQTFFVLLSGACLGPVRGGLSQCLFLSFGAAGIPLFSGNGAGMLYIMGPTGGYLASFPLAACFCGALFQRSKGLTERLAAFVLADLFILGLGTLWLSLYTGNSLGTAFLAGFLPFLPGDAVKIALASAVLSKRR